MIGVVGEGGEITRTRTRRGIGMEEGRVLVVWEDLGESWWML